MCVCMCERGHVHVHVCTCACVCEISGRMNSMSVCWLLVGIVRLALSSICNINDNNDDKFLSVPTCIIMFVCLYVCLFY